MPHQNFSRIAFNRGLLSPSGQARVDLPRTALSAEVMVNWDPRVLGPMALRPGLEHIRELLGQSRQFPFVYSVSETAQLDISDGAMRVAIDDVLLTRATVTAATTNGNFTTDLTGWTDSDEAGSTSSWSAGAMALLGNGTTAAIRDQQVTLVETGVVHALRIIVSRGPVMLRVGSSSGDDDYINETALGTGTHSLAFTPTTNFHIRFLNRRSFTTLVDSCNVEAAGTVSVPTPWVPADFFLLRAVQSNDVIYMACTGYQTRKIERRSAASWSVVLYEPETPPLLSLNSTPVTLTPSALSGDVTLTASAALFKSTNVGSIFRIDSVGQTVSASLTGDNQFTTEIRVAGVGGQRAFGIMVTGTWSATVTLQASVAEPGNWIDVEAYTVNQSKSFNDDLDNQIIYYRMGIKTAEYTSGTAVANLSYTSGSISGRARVTAYSSATVVSAVTLVNFGAVTASSDWQESRWSTRRTFPSANTIFEGRLWFGSKDRIDGSESDFFESFDEEVEGDSGPISRIIGEGPVQTVNWMIPLNRLLIGTIQTCANIAPVKLDRNNVLSGRSSSFDEPLTPSNFNLKPSAPGCAFVQRARNRLLAINFNIEENDYAETDLSISVPDLHEYVPGDTDRRITHIATEYEPEKRIHCLRADGTATVCIFDRAENVICWVEVETDALIEDICVQPGTERDRVYYSVNRDGDRYLWKFALREECRGGMANKQADGFVHYDGSSADTITGLDHLEGETVVAWGDGIDLGTYTVINGRVTLSQACAVATVGLAYQARWKSSKNAFGDAAGTPLNQPKRIDALGLILQYTHCQGVQYGPDFDTLDDLPLVEDYDELDTDTVHSLYDKDSFEFPGDWSTDSRLCLVANAPRPCTVLAATLTMQTNDKVG